MALANPGLVSREYIHDKQHERRNEKGRKENEEDRIVYVLTVLRDLELTEVRVASRSGHVSCFSTASANHNFQALA